MRRPAASALLLHSALLLGVSSTFGAEGVYLLRGGQTPRAATANGYVQSVTDRGDGESLVRVATTLAPVRAQGSYAAVKGATRSAVPDGFRLPMDLAARLRGDGSAYEAATVVLEWVMDTVRLDNNDRAPQDATSVLARRRGRCSGLANLSAALLLAAGFEARTVSGLLVDSHGGIPHRWVECRLPGAGWVPSDPTLGPWVITPRHLAFADAVEDVPSLTIVTWASGSLAELPRRQGRPSRPDVGSELVCRVVGDAEGPVRARLEGPAGETRNSLLAPDGRFSDLIPGRWLLVVEAGGRELERRELLLAAGTVHTYTVQPQTGEGS